MGKVLKAEEVQIAWDSEGDRGFQWQIKILKESRDSEEGRGFA